MEINLTPVVSQKEQVFKSNKDEIKTYFEAQLEKYKGLVVTEENYKEMVSAKNEIVSIEQRLINSVKRKNENSKDRLNCLRKK